MNFKTEKKFSLSFHHSFGVNRKKEHKINRYKKSELNSCFMDNEVEIDYTFYSYFFRIEMM